MQRIKKSAMYMFLNLLILLENLLVTNSNNNSSNWNGKFWFFGRGGTKGWNSGLCECQLSTLPLSYALSPQIFTFKDLPNYTDASPSPQCTALYKQQLSILQLFWLCTWGEYEIPENELSFQQSLKLLTDSSQ